MDALRSAPLTASGMIELQHGEVELRTLTHARLRMHSNREASSSVFETEARGVTRVFGGLPERLLLSQSFPAR